MRKQKQNGPKILYFDIENAPNVTYTWGIYEQNVLSVTKEWYIISFAYKWNEGSVNVLALPHFELYKTDPTDDKELVKKLWELFDEADIIVAHNGDAFDIKKANARFLFHGLPPPQPYKTIDTLKVARKYFKLNSNKLDDLGKYLKVGRKLEHTGFSLWEGCLNGDEKSWRLMCLYNKRDVDLLYKVYDKLKGWMANHPNVNIYNDELNKCPVCGSHKLQKRGFGYTKLGRYQRYQCTECGAWSRGPIIRTETNITQ